MEVTYYMVMYKTNFKFESRKIQNVRYSYLLPLPVSWVKNMKISKGDSLSIEMQEDNSLRITVVPEAHQDSAGTRVQHIQLKEEM